MMKKIFYLFIFITGISQASAEIINICDRGVIGDKIAEQLYTTCDNVDSEKMKSDIKHIILSYYSDRPVREPVPLTQKQFMGLDSLVSFVADLVSLPSIEDAAFSPAQSLKSITIFAAGSHINPNAFSGLKKLESLSLISNSWRQFPNFQGLESLAYLDLQRSSFTVIPKGAFSGLTNLKVLKLNLNGTSVNTIDPEAFKDTSLESLSLNFLPPVEVFTHLKSLKSLSFIGSKSSIPSLGDYAFYGLRNLEKLYLQHSGGGRGIEYISPKAFAGLTSLKKLTLSGNYFNKILPNTFSGLLNLEKIIYYSGGTVVISQDTFDFLSKLKVDVPSRWVVGSFEND